MVRCSVHADCARNFYLHFNSGGGAVHELVTFRLLLIVSRHMSDHQMVLFHALRDTIASVMQVAGFHLY